MKEIRIGDKIISMDRAKELIEKIFDLRSNGHTQEEVAAQLGLERSFISRLEGIGEIRRARQIALIGSEVKDAKALEATAQTLGIDYVFLMNHKRLKMRDLLHMIGTVKDLDYIVFVGPADELTLIEKVLDTKIIGVPLEKEHRLEGILKELSEKRTRRSFRSIRRGEQGERSRKREPWVVTPQSRS